MATGSGKSVSRRPYGSAAPSRGTSSQAFREDAVDASAPQAQPGRRLASAGPYTRLSERPRSRNADGRQRAKRCFVLSPSPPEHVCIATRECLNLHGPESKPESGAGYSHLMSLSYGLFLMIADMQMQMQLLGPNETKAKAAINITATEGPGRACWLAPLPNEGPGARGDGGMSAMLAAQREIEEKRRRDRLRAKRLKDLNLRKSMIRRVRVCDSSSLLAASMRV